MDGDLTVENALDVVRHIFAPSELSYVEELVFVRTWEGQRYREMALDSGYEEGYLKDVGAKLWSALSKRIGYPVSKKRLRFILEDVASRIPASAWQPSTSSVPSRLLSSMSTAPPISISPPSIAVNLPEVTPWVGVTQSFGPESPGSPLPFQSRWYIKRPPLEEMAMGILQQPGGLLRIRGVSKVGKTSLIHQLLGEAQQKNMRTVLLDLRQTESSTFESLDNFLRWFCWATTQKLGLSLNVDDYWFPGAGSKLSCTNYIQTCVLSPLDSPVVIAIDTMHYLSSHVKLACEFVTMLRSWYEQSRAMPIWGKLRLVLSYTAELDLPLATHQSPFNVGVFLELKSLTLDQAQTLARVYQFDDNLISPEQLAVLFERVGGCPCLLQLAFYWLQYGHVSMAQLLEDITSETGVYGEYLQSLWLRLQQADPLWQAWKQVVQADHPVTLDLAVARSLEVMGLVKLDNREATPRCSLYKDYFARFFV